MHNNFFTFNNFFGKLHTEESVTVYGYENISQPRKHGYQTIDDNGGCYGYVQSGSALLRIGENTFIVRSGFWFTTKSGFEIMLSEKSRAIVFQKNNYNGLFSMGEVEQ
jgi:hypothetical protein